MTDKGRSGDMRRGGGTCPRTGGGDIRRGGGTCPRPGGGVIRRGGGTCPRPGGGDIRRGGGTCPRPGGGPRRSGCCCPRPGDTRRGGDEGRARSTTRPGLAPRLGSTSRRRDGRPLRSPSSSRGCSGSRSRRVLEPSAAAAAGSMSVQSRRRPQLPSLPVSCFTLTCAALPDCERRCDNSSACWSMRCISNLAEAGLTSWPSLPRLMGRFLLRLFFRSLQLLKLTPVLSSPRTTRTQPSSTGGERLDASWTRTG